MLTEYPIIVVLHGWRVFRFTIYLVLFHFQAYSMAFTDKSLEEALLQCAPMLPNCIRGPLASVPPIPNPRPPMAFKKLQR